MCSTCAAAGLGAMVSSAAISRLVIPAATSRATSHSRADKAPGEARTDAVGRVEAAAPATILGGFAEASGDNRYAGIGAPRFAYASLALVMMAAASAGRRL